MSDAPERIAIKKTHGYEVNWYRVVTNIYDDCGVEYIRADKVKALVDAAKPYISPVQNADYGRQLRQHEALCAALRAIEAE